MRRIESIEDQWRGVVTYEMPDGTRLRVEEKMVRERGLAQIMRDHGFTAPAGRVDVYQDDRRVGTLPADFDPLSARSRSALYCVRPGDFRREDDRWVASRSLGPGDLDAVVGFSRA